LVPHVRQLFLERIITATIATKKQRGQDAMKGPSGCTLQIEDKR